MEKIRLLSLVVACFGLAWTVSLALPESIGRDAVGMGLLALAWLAALVAGCREMAGYNDERNA